MNAELLGAAPEVALVKTECIVAEKDIGIPPDHCLGPAVKHGLLRAVGVNHGVLDGPAGPHDEYVALVEWGS